MKNKDNIRDQVVTLCAFLQSYPQALILARLWNRSPGISNDPIADFDYGVAQRSRQSRDLKIFLIVTLVWWTALAWVIPFKLLDSGSLYFIMTVATCICIVCFSFLAGEKCKGFSEWDRFRETVEEMSRHKKNPFPSSLTKEAWREFARKELVQIAAYKITAQGAGDYELEGDIHHGFTQAHERFKEFGLVEGKWGTYFAEAEEFVAEEKKRQADELHRILTARKTENCDLPPQVPPPPAVPVAP